MRYFFLLLISFVVLLSGGCGKKYDYTIHKPKVKYRYPSKQALNKTLSQKLGSRYIWAEEGPNAFDCSGLVYYAYGTMNMTTPRVASKQALVGMPIKRSQLQYGDLIFFDTSKKRTGKVTHVGIYVGNNKFEHAASTKKGVIISSLDKPYYKSRVLSYRRYLPSTYRYYQYPSYRH